jgi:hypothetical protein
VLFSVSLAALGCSDDDGSGGSGGSGGVGGSAGSSAGSGGTSGSTAGSAGSGGSAGVATGGSAGSTGGSAGSAGSGGESGSTGGSAGSAGGSATPLCQTAADCTFHSDCCTCQALGPGEPTPPACPVTCVTDKCTSLGVNPSEIACAAGQCVLQVDCDASKVTCKVAQPACQAGEVPSVNGTCWGPCIAATECSVVTNCSDCDAASEACVRYVTQLGPEHHCVPLPPECGTAASCACMGAAVCIDPFSTCNDESGASTLACSCPVC